MDSLLFNATPDRVGGLIRLFCFVNEAECRGEFTKKHLLKNEAVLDLTAAASLNGSKLFNNALSGNVYFDYVVKKLMQWGGMQ